jgi:hypothetical protein
MGTTSCAYSISRKQGRISRSCIGFMIASHGVAAQLRRHANRAVPPPSEGPFTEVPCLYPRGNSPRSPSGDGRTRPYSALATPTSAGRRQRSPTA